MTEQPPSGAAAERRADHQQLAVRMLAERCQLQARQALLEPAIGIPMICLVLVTLHPGIAADQLIAWSLLLGATLLLRSVCAARFITRRRRDDADTVSIAGVFNLTAGLSGLLIGACAGLFFAQVDHTTRLILTVLIFAWLALGVLTYAPFPRHALLFGGAVLAQLAVAWALAPGVPGLLVATGVLLYGALLAQLSTVLSRALLQAMRRKHRIRQLARRLSEQREQAVRSSRSAARFLAAASHDLRQPATSLGLLITLIRERCQDPALLPLISAVDRSVTTLSDLLASLLDLSRLESNTMQPQHEWLSVEELFEALREEFEPRAHERGLTLLVTSAPIKILADRILIARLLRNLLDNAMRYTDRGAVTLAAAWGERCVLSVTDTGIGIAPEHLERIFDEHVRISSPHRRAPPGLGLGLAMVRRLAQLLDARICAHSDGTRGSRFELSFALDRAAPDDAMRAATERRPEPTTLNRLAPIESSAAPGASTPSATRAKVLLVDDDPDVAQALQSLFEARGWQTDVATDASAAFARLGSSSDWALLLTDCTLNGKPDGLALALAARLARPDLQCLLLTADTSADLERQALAHGLQLVHKPVNELALMDALQNRDHAAR
ncbi:MAG: hybrid sensor histidine kinase/response regulator [Betaproteobacteria bacterium]|nr:hybrid sensor histidine kinase/response regulator [Betaproteobacteria bacterium]